MKGRRPLTSEEVARLVGCARDARERALFAVCIWTGARISEAVALTLDDVVRVRNGVVEARSDLEFRRGITKGQREGRQVKLHDTVAAYVIRYVETERGTEIGPLFTASPSGRCKAEGNRLSVRHATRIFGAALARADIFDCVGTQSGRKTFAQRLYEGGTHLATIQENLGHADVRTTTRYFRVNRANCAAAVAALPPGPPLPPEENTP